MSTKRKVTKKEIIDKVAEYSGYHKYEVEDILTAYYDTVREELEDGNMLEMPKLFRFWLEKPKPRIITSGYTHRTFVSPAYVKIKYKPIRTYTDYLEKDFCGKVFVDRRENESNASVEQNRS